MMHQRVFVTGAGLVSALGLDAKTHFQRLLKKESGVKVSRQPEYQNFASKLEARVTGFDRHALITNRMLMKLLSPSAGYAVAAAGEAIASAGLESCHPFLKKCGLYVGSISVDINPDVFIPAFRESLNPQGAFEISRFAKRGIKLLDPLFLVKALPNAGLCGISVQHQTLGPNTNITNGATAGLQAIALATAAIRRGEVDCALAGGYDSLLSLDSIADQMIANRLSRRQSEPEHACRPFDRERDGYAVGEGAAFVFLESESHARARRAMAFGEILAISHTSDASLILRHDSEDGSALAYAARQALCQAACSPEELGVIFGDGLATEIDDRREAKVIQDLAGDRSIPFTSPTGAIGFTGATSGAFSLAHAIMALQKQVVPPLINCFEPDPQCSISFLDHLEKREYSRALVWNSERGIKNVAVLIGSADP
jgi:3-oxoacyl-[acyl-carrier-protein] synthase II